MAADEIDFNREIRPILSDKCFRCHGPDEAERKAGLRLDLRDRATAQTDSGAIAIVPGDTEASELVRRILSDDESERMPPAESKKTLTEPEKQKLVAWIRQGGEYREHWAFVKPARLGVPADPFEHWARNPIDHFIAVRLAAEGLCPSPEAARETLIRRLTLDLTGLPPTLAEIDAFVSDSSERAYENLVDRLLASPHYGERMALDWLDAARFADTNGYHLDNGRDMTRWRAWVIDAYNRNLPFDEFTIQQIAGDLLPFASTEQMIASGFHRNHMINFEGGAIPEEYLNAYIVDRVNTTGMVWLGLSIACAQCHDHKYDPISQREYYQLYAFFHNVPEKGLDGNQGNAAPVVQLPSREQSEKLAALNVQIREVSRRKDRLEQALNTQQQEWEANGALKAELPAHIRKILDTALGERDDASRVKLANHFRRQVAKDEAWLTAANELDKLNKQRALLEASLPTAMVMGELDQPRQTFVLIRGQYDQRGEEVTGGVPASLHPFPTDAPVNRLGLARWLVSPENPLTSRVIVNRLWQSLFGTGLVKTAEDFGSQGEPPSHPELLDWLACEFQRATRPELVGTGCEAWNVKGLVKLMVMSATYRQSSHVTPQLLEKDPDNRLLARGARYRLAAEFIRDQALSVSGLLKHNIGGPSVSPYQPAGLWTELSSRGDSANWTAQSFVQSHGDDLYRRSMYTFWKRTCPPPQMSAFDAPDRETCVVRRARTNTPLQALILMNDPTYLEASRRLAERILNEGGDDVSARLTFAFRLLTGRTPSESEIQVMSEILSRQEECFREDPAAAGKLLAAGESPVTSDRPPAEIATWCMLANTLLNLDEVISKN
jgi:hypothetical protein